VLAWCPIERDVLPLGSNRALLAPAAANFTVLVKNQIEFPMYNARRTNVLESSNKSYLSACKYNRESDPFCPVFRLGDVVAEAGEDFEALAVRGGVISVGIHWDCDLDYDFTKYCRPQYKFRRLDNPKSKIAPGWNFRHSQYFYNGNRTLYKTYGILFVLDVQGRAGKLSFIPFAVNLGAGLALLSIATVVCDVIVLYCMKDRRVYREKKYLHVRGSDAYSVFNDGEEENLVAERQDDDQEEIREESVS